MGIIKLKPCNRSCKISSALNTADFKVEYFTRLLRDYLAAQRTTQVGNFQIKDVEVHSEFRSTVKKDVFSLLKYNSPFCT